MPGDEGCLFDEEDSFAGCPGRAGLSDGIDGKPVWQGTLQFHEACSANWTNDDGKRIGDSWLGCIRYDGGTYSTMGSPGSNYWMLTANDDPAFDQCNPGPPNASESIVTLSQYGLFKAEAQTNSSGNQRINLMLNENQSPEYCSKVGGDQENIPFIAFGAQSDKGNGGPVATIGNNPLYDNSSVLNFRARLHARLPFECDTGSVSCNSSSHGVHAGVYFIAEWDDVPKLVFVNLYANGNGIFADHPDQLLLSKWNWPIYESAYWPGGEIISVGHNSVCASHLDPITTSTARNYSIDIGDIFRCLNTQGAFGTSLPTSGVDIEGVHWFIEATGDSGRFRWWFENAYMSNS